MKGSNTKPEVLTDFFVLAGSDCMVFFLKMAETPTDSNVNWENKDQQRDFGVTRFEGLKQTHIGRGQNH